MKYSDVTRSINEYIASGSTDLDIRKEIIAKAQELKCTFLCPSSWFDSLNKANVTEDSSSNSEEEDPEGSEEDTKKDDSGEDTKKENEEPEDGDSNDDDSEKDESEAEKKEPAKDSLPDPKKDPVVKSNRIVKACLTFVSEILKAVSSPSLQKAIDSSDITEYADDEELKKLASDLGMTVTDLIQMLKDIASED